MTDVAYRWDIICDFTGYTDKVRTLPGFHFTITTLPTVESEQNPSSSLQRLHRLTLVALANAERNLPLQCS